tara:strand:- start:124 stop:822 length:699 start_codon:yes stop_codon:yes gene_type:complete
MLFTVIGTLSHELGHITMAELLGNDAKLFYGSMTSAPEGYWEDEDVIAFQKFFEDNREKLEANPTEREKLLEPYFKPIEEKYPRNPSRSILITIGGPLQTILTSIIGLFMLYFRKSKHKSEFKVLDWLGVFLALFILREVFNGVQGLLVEVFGKVEFYAGDEFGISKYLGWNVWALPSIMMIIGTAVSVYIIFKVISIQYRFSFILAGLVGGLSGFAIWFGYLGPILLPVEI